MGLSAVKDQSMPIRFLRNTMRLKRVPHALLFWGPEGVGKRFTAFELAKALNCLENDGDGCGECLSCRKIEHGNHPDVKFIKPAGKAGVIKKQVMEEIAELTAYRPFSGRKRVVIIESAECMSLASQHFFLKTLEEPMSDSVFVLLSGASSRLLPTIRSRCQAVRFGTLHPETVTELLLRERDLPESVAAAIAALSQGQISRAKDLVDTERREVVLSTTERLFLGEDPLLLSEDFAGHLKQQAEAIRAKHLESAPGDHDEGLTKEERDELKEAKVAAAESEIRRDMMEYMYLFQTWYRDGMVYAASHASGRLLNLDQSERLSREATKANAAKLDAIGQAWVYIDRNLNVERVFRDLFLKLAA